MDIIDYIYHPEKTDEIKKLLNTDSSVIIIDPLSLYNKSVRRRLDWILGDFQKNKKAPNIMVVMPFPKPEPYSGLKKQIRWTAPQIFYYFYEPWEQPNESMAHCEAQIDDEHGVKKFLVNILKPSIKQPSKELHSVYTSVGSK